MNFRSCLEIAIISGASRVVMIVIIGTKVTTKIEEVVEEVGIIKGMIIITEDQALGITEIVEGERFPVTLFGI